LHFSRCFLTLTAAFGAAGMLAASALKTPEIKQPHVQATEAKLPDAKSGPEKKLSGYEVEEATALNGKYRVTAVDDAVRIDHHNYGYVVISRAPTWDVFLYRPDTREYAQIPYKAWLKTNLVMLTTLWTMELKKAEKEKRYLKNGLPYVCYHYPNTEVLSGFYRSTDRDEFKDLVNNRAEILCLDYPKDIHVGGVSGRVIALPELQGIALTAVRKSAKVNSWSLKSASTKRRNDISSTVFELPKGLKKVPFTRHLFSSATERDTINDMLGDPADQK